MSLQPLSQNGKSKVVVLVGTRKGGYTFSSDASRKNWQASDLKFKGWQVMQSPLAEPKNALEILAKSIKADETTCLRTAQSLLPTAWATLGHAGEYARLARGQKAFLVQLFPEGGVVIDAHRKLVKRLEY